MESSLKKVARKKPVDQARNSLVRAMQ